MKRAPDFEFAPNTGDFGRLKRVARMPGSRAASINLPASRWGAASSRSPPCRSGGSGILSRPVGSRQSGHCHLGAVALSLLVGSGFDLVVVIPTPHDETNASRGRAA